MASTRIYQKRQLRRSRDFLYSPVKPIHGMMHMQRHARARTRKVYVSTYRHFGLLLVREYKSVTHFLASAPFLPFALMLMLPSRELSSHLYRIAVTSPTLGRQFCFLCFFPFSTSFSLRLAKQTTTLQLVVELQDGCLDKFDRNLNNTKCSTLIGILYRICSQGHAKQTGFGKQEPFEFFLKRKPM